MSVAEGPTAAPFSDGASPPRGSGHPGEAYRSQADRYDRRTAACRRWREQLVDLLPAQPGDTVLDVGCGTGLCMPLLQEKIGATGTIVGVDASAQMLDVAAERVAERRWDNVRLVTAPIESAPLPGTADAALFCAVHDVMQSRAALTNVFGHLRPGAPVAATGGKWPGPWTWPWGPRGGGPPPPGGTPGAPRAPPGGRLRRGGPRLPALTAQDIRLRAASATGT